MLGPKKIRSKDWVEIFFWYKQILSTKILVKKFLVQKICLKNLGTKEICVKKILVLTRTKFLHFPDILLVPTRHPPDNFQTPSKHSPNIFLTPSKHPQGTHYPSPLVMIFSQGTRAQHLTLCVCVCVVFPGWMRCSDRSERKDNCVQSQSVCTVHVCKEPWAQHSHE